MKKAEPKSPSWLCALGDRQRSTGVLDQALLTPLAEEKWGVGEKREKKRLYQFIKLTDKNSPEIL